MPGSRLLLPGQEPGALAACPAASAVCPAAQLSAAAPGKSQGSALRGLPWVSVEQGQVRENKRNTGIHPCDWPRRAEGAGWWHCQAVPAGLEVPWPLGEVGGRAADKAGGRLPSRGIGWRKELMGTS